MEDFFKQFKDEQENKKKEHELLMESQAYQQEMKFFHKIISDFITTINCISIYSTRYQPLNENSIMIRELELILESIVGISKQIEEGTLNPAKRELRFMLESSVKYLLVDQKTNGLTHEEKIHYFDKNIPSSSIDSITEIRFFGLNNEEVDEFRNDVKVLFSKLCQYVHPSKYQINEYLRRCQKGAFIGFETQKEINDFNKLLFRILDIIIVLLFEVLGFSFTGDLFIYVFDEIKDYKFKKGKYVSKYSKGYDYKAERKNIASE